MDVDLTRRAFTRKNLTNVLIVARDGQEAIDRIDSWNLEETPCPAVILLDLKLPRVDGLEVLRHIRADPRFLGVPVVILTTSAEDTDIRTAYLHGANSYIVKPVSFDRFLDVAVQINLYWTVLNAPLPANAG